MDDLDNVGQSPLSGEVVNEYSHGLPDESMPREAVEEVESSVMDSFEFEDEEEEDDFVNSHELAPVDTRFEVGNTMGKGRPKGSKNFSTQISEILGKNMPDNSGATSKERAASALALRMARIIEGDDDKLALSAIEKTLDRLEGKTVGRTISHNTHSVGNFLDSL